MKAVICEKPFLLKEIDIEKPVPKPNEALINIKRVGICGTDMHIYTGNQPFISYPRIMGHELSGIIEIAPEDSELKAGDIVYIMPYISCGKCNACLDKKTNCCKNINVLGVHKDGGMTEYICVGENFVFNANGLSLDEAALLEFLSIGYHAVRRANIKPNQNILINGVGPIGIAVCIFSKMFGAKVTVIDGRQSRIDFCKNEIGIDNGLLLSENNNDELAQITNNDFFDIVFDATGSTKAIENGFKYVAHGGTYVLVSVVSSNITFNDPEFHKRETTLLGSRNATKEDFIEVLNAIKTGKVPTKALISHKANLSDLPNIMQNWIEPSTNVIKAIVEC